MKIFGSHPDQVADLLALGCEEASDVEEDCTPRIEGYDCRELIAEGGMGSVWCAVQLGTGREVALKIVAPRVAGSTRGLARFMREVTLTARLEHPHIARVYDSGVHQGLYYYAMEFVEGEHLDRYVQCHHLSSRQIVALFDKICAAVQHAHQHGIIHRDLKPSNILVSQNGQVHVLDFGLAKALETGDDERELSLSGEAIGTLTTMSPEQASGQLDIVDTRADVYALAAILYRLLVGQWPVDTDGPRQEALQRIRTQDAQRPRRLQPHFDRDLEAILLMGLEKEPEQRYQSVAQLRRDLNCWCQDWPISARSQSSIYLLRKVVRRHRVASASVGLLIVIVLCLSFLSFWSGLEARRALASRQRLDELGQQVVEAQTNLAEDVRLGIQQQALGWLLLAWHQGRENEARLILTQLPAASPYAQAATFLLQGGSQEEFLQTLGTQQQALAQFVLGEVALKQGQPDEALQAYRQCDLQTSDSWLTQRIEARIAALQEGQP